MIQNLAPGVRARVGMPPSETGQQQQQQQQQSRNDPSAYMELMRSYQTLEAQIERLRAQLREAQHATQSKDTELTNVKQEFFKWRSEYRELSTKERRPSDSGGVDGAAQQQHLQLPPSRRGSRHSLQGGFQTAHLDGIQQQPQQQSDDAEHTPTYTVDELAHFLGKTAARRYVTRLEDTEHDPVGRVHVLDTLMWRIMVRGRVLSDRVTAAEDEAQGLRDQLPKLQRKAEFAESQRNQILMEFSKRDHEVKEQQMWAAEIRKYWETVVSRISMTQREHIDACAALVALAPSRAVMRSQSDAICTANRRQLNDFIKSCPLATRVHKEQMQIMVHRIDGILKAPVIVEENTNEEEEGVVGGADEAAVTSPDVTLDVSDVRAPHHAVEEQTYLPAIVTLVMQTTCYCCCVLFVAKTGGSSAKNPIPRPLVRRHLTSSDKELLTRWVGEVRWLLELWRVVRKWFPVVDLVEADFLKQVDTFVTSLDGGRAAASTIASLSSSSVDGNGPAAVIERMSKSARASRRESKKLEGAFGKLFHSMTLGRLSPEMKELHSTVARVNAHTADLSRLNWKGLVKLHRLENMKNTVYTALNGQENIDHLLVMYTEKMEAEKKAWLTKRGHIRMTRYALWCDFLSALQSAEDSVIKTGIDVNTFANLKSDSAMSLAVDVYNKILKRMEIEQSSGAENLWRRAVFGTPAVSAHWEDRSFVAKARERHLDRSFGAKSAELVREMVEKKSKKDRQQPQREVFAFLNKSLTLALEEDKKSFSSTTTSSGHAMAAAADQIQSVMKGLSQRQRASSAYSTRRQQQQQQKQASPHVGKLRPPSKGSPGKVRTGVM
eukprot:PhM_4_TR11695/c1_g1_i1/m.23648